MTVVAFERPISGFRSPRSIADLAAELITLGPDKTSAEIADAVIRGECRIYTIVARAGQRLSLSLTSVEDNAAFTICGPRSHAPWAIASGECHGGQLNQDECETDWSGALNENGVYTIAISPTRGNASYALFVALDEAA